MTNFVVATDGGAWPNPGAGAYAYIVQVIETGTLWTQVTKCERIADTTNNLAELIAVREAVKQVRALISAGVGSLTNTPEVTIVCDSLNVINWIRGSFKVEKPTIGALVWEIDEQMEQAHISVKWVHVKGHQSVFGADEYTRLNQRCDTMIKALRESK